MLYTDIPTEFEEVDGPHQKGIERAFKADEDFVLDGERIERETKVELLKDGGVHIVQRVPAQDIFDSLTLNEAVVRKIIREYGDE